MPKVKIPKPKERTIQRAYFDWVMMMRNQDERFKLIVHYPAGSTDPKWNGIMVADGMAVDWLDVQIMIPSKKFPGMFIEFKQPGKKPRKGQNEIARLLTLQGYCCYLCTDAETAIFHTRNYLGLDAEQKKPH